MAALPDDIVAEAREVFAYFDSKGDDKITVHQIGDVLRALGQNPTQAEIQQCSAKWSNLEHRIGLEEFIPIFEDVWKKQDRRSAEEFIEGFLCHFDKDGNGFVSVAELRHLLTTLGERLTDEEADQLLNGQEDTNGMVNVAEFVKQVVNP